MKKKLLTISLVMLVYGMDVCGQATLVEKILPKAGEVSIPYEKYKLPNGLTLIVHEDHSDPIVYVDVTYHVGSAREEIGKSGFAHFFEHMMFQGSDHVADGQHIKMMTAAGATLNGTTNRDRTNYFEVVPNNQLEKSLWLEADRMGFLLDAVTQKKFEIQRSTVKNERGQRYENVPYGLVTETYSRFLYPYGHPYSWLTIGYPEELNKVNVNDLKNFFLRWYGPNNATVTIAGDVRTAEAVKLVEKYFASIPRGPEVTKVVLPPVHVESKRYASYTDNYARSSLLSITFPTLPDYNKDKASLECFTQIFGQGKSSLLYQHLVKKQMAFQAYCYNNFSELSGELVVQLVPSAGKNLKDMEQLFYTTLDSFEKRGVTDEDIARFKGSIESQIINGLQSVQGKGTILASFQTLTGNANKIAELLKMYANVTKEDVMRVYKTYIKDKGAVFLSVLTRADQLAAADDNFKTDSSAYSRPDYGYAGLTYMKAKDNFDRMKIPANGPAPVIKVPSFWRKDLPNGVRMIGSENNEIPAVTFTLTLPGGHLAQADNLQKAGLSNMFALMMMEDTKNYTAEQLSIELQKLGSSINVNSTIDGVTFTVQALKKNLDKTLSLLEERLFHPLFSESSFNRVKKQTLESFRFMKAQPGIVADDVFAKLNYGPGHILGISGNGTEETVKNITLKDIEDYYNKYLTSVHTKAVVVGAVTQEEIMPQLGFLNKLPKKDVSNPEIPPVQPVDKTKIYLVDVPKGAQTEFRIGYVTGLTYNPTGEYYKANLANFALGGGFNSRLNLNLRESKGWTYGAGSSISGDQYTGEFTFSSGIRTDATDSALVETMKDMKNYIDNGITEEEFVFTKNAIAQSDARKYETTLQKAQFIRRILDYNLPPDFTTKQQKILTAITKDELNKISRKYLDPEKMNIVLVGDKEKIWDKIKKLGYQVIEVDTDGKPLDKKAF